MERQLRAEPQPFQECPQRGGQTQAQEHAQARADAAVSPVQGKVAHAEADHPAQKEPRQARAGETTTEGVGPQGQAGGGQDQPAEVRRACPEQTRAAPALTADMANRIEVTIAWIIQGRLSLHTVLQFETIQENPRPVGLSIGPAE